MTFWSFKFFQAFFFFENHWISESKFLPRRFMLFFSSVMDMFDAALGIVATCMYPFGRGFLVNMPDTGRQIKLPHLTAPLFINAPVIMPLLWIAWKGFYCIYIIIVWSIFYCLLSPKIFINLIYILWNLSYKYVIL